MEAVLEVKTAKLDSGSIMTVKSITSCTRASNIPEGQWTGPIKPLRAAS
jgi:hypothetical protein